MTVILVLISVCLSDVIIHAVAGNAQCNNAKILQSIQLQFGMIDQDAMCNCQETKIRKTAFLAKLQKHINGLKQFAPVIFETAITNVGGAYDATNGFFTAPREGTYAFSWTTLTHKGSSFFTEIVINGKPVGVKNHGHGDGRSTVNTISTQNAVVILQKKDKVWIRTTRKSGFCYADSWTTFSGYEL